MGERRRYEPGSFCWVGLATSDPASAKDFYTTLFGWHAEDLPAVAAGTVTLLRHRGHDVAILYEQMPEARAAGASPAWSSTGYAPPATTGTPRAPNGSGSAGTPGSC